MSHYSYILHTRPFRDTSLIVELFSKEHGRVAVVAKSARGLKSRFKGQLQLFTPMMTAWVGKHELKTLTHLELSGMPIALNQKALFSAFYVNELIIKLLHKEDPYPILFDHYELCLKTLAKNTAIEIALRVFEKKLLDVLGYGLPLQREANTGKKIEENAYYAFLPGQGFVLGDHDADVKTLFSGQHLHAIGNEQFDVAEIAISAKRLMRMALSALLGNNTLNSRLFF